MARIPAAPRPGPLTRVALATTRRMFGRSLEPHRVVAHHRGVFWVTAVSETMLLRQRHRLPDSLRDLVQHRVAVVIGCPWCIDFGAMLALRGGLTAERIMAVPDYETSDLFTPLERRAMAFADAATATPTTVTDEQVADLRAELGDAGVVELAHLVALENQRSRLNHALGITSQGFTDAAVCALPGLGGVSPGGA